MARIAFFTERLPPDPDPAAGFAFELMRSLAEQQHEILICSTYRAGENTPALHSRMELIRPFRSWSWLEVPRLIPLLMQFRPEILHLIQPRAEALRGFTNAMTAIPALSAVLGAGRGRVPVVSSFYDVRAQDLKYHRPLLSMSHAVTTPNEPQRSLIEGFSGALKKAPPVFVLPVSSAHSSSDAEDAFSTASAPEPLLEFLDRGHDFIFVPGHLHEHTELDLVFSELITVLKENLTAHVVFGGGWGPTPMRERHAMMRRLAAAGVDHRVVLAGSLRPETEKVCLARARAVFTASLPAESLDLARLLREALEASAVLVMSERQANIDPLAWRDGENALIASALPGEWSRRLLNALHSPDLSARIRQRLPEFTRLEAVDLPGNVMSRIYTQVLYPSR